jgi:phosphoserine phosphatase RsbU/P
MSQMKGMFHSLSQLDLGAGEFIVRANDAMARCLDKASFVTTSYFILDSDTRQIELTRAGHCPTLYYSHMRDEAVFFQNKGLGLGIIRNETFREYTEVNKITYAAGDVMVLYTDGIVEAMNRKGEEFGYERLRNVLKENREASASVIQKTIIKKLYEFIGTDVINDDYTMVIVRFI